MNMNVRYVTGKSDEISENYRAQFVDLVTLGGQVKRHFVKAGVANAVSLALVLDRDQVIAGCCLKNPLPSYRDRVFINSKTARQAADYQFELGYIVTHPDHEGKGYCKNMLSEFLSDFSSLSIFATTRKAAMAHILSKYGFYKTGCVYKDGLELLVFDGDL